MPFNAVIFSYMRDLPLSTRNSRFAQLCQMESVLLFYQFCTLIVHMVSNKNVFRTKFEISCQTLDYCFLSNLNFVSGYWVQIMLRIEESILSIILIRVFPLYTANRLPLDSVLGFKFVSAIFLQNRNCLPNILI